MRRRVLFVGRTRYRLPLSDSQRLKWDALAARFELRVLGTAAGDGANGDATFHLVRPLKVRALDGPAFYSSLPLRIAREIRDFAPDVVVTQSPYEAVAALSARRLARRNPALVVEVHGDWRSFARLYGSPARRLAAPVADRIAPAALRRADAVRTLSDFTTGLVRGAGTEPAAVFTTFTDLEAFSEPPLRPLPPGPAALFVGVLEPYKNVDGIAAAWRLAAPRVPSARLLLVGDGRRRDIVQGLLADLPAQTEWKSSLPTEGVVAALDASWCLLLPSRSEGTPRVTMEALCRGRAVIGGRAGGIPDVVHDSENGALVDPEDHAAIAAALVSFLSDRSLAERLGEAAAHDAGRWRYTPTEYAERYAELIERAVSRR